MMQKNWKKSQVLIRGAQYVDPDKPDNRKASKGNSQIITYQ